MPFGDYGFRTSEALVAENAKIHNMEQKLADRELTADLHAMVSWESGRLALNGGLISTTQFKFQEKFWGYRYVWKSFQDEYKFGSSADLGLSDCQYIIHHSLLHY